MRKIGTLIRSTLMIGLLSILPTSVSSEGSSGKKREVYPCSRTKSSCTISGPVRITESDLLYDCQGGTIDAQGADAAITIGTADEQKNVTVRNCLIINTSANGIVIGWDKTTEQLSEMTHLQAYKAAPSQISIEDTTIKSPQKHGIYVRAYSSQIRISGVKIIGYKQIGLYLDFSSRENVVDASSFVGDNPTREAIAVDSSAYNKISNNHFSAASSGGVMLYRNCQEHISKDPKSPLRWQPSMNNQIFDNTFEDAAVGVWIASRQSKNLQSFDCGMPSYDGGIHFLDAAPDNLVQGNKFNRVKTPIIIEDDSNRIVDNTMSDGRVCLTAGSEFRSKILGHPVKLVTIIGNRCFNNSRGTEGFRILFGTKVKDFKGNLIDGNPAPQSN